MKKKTKPDSTDAKLKTLAEDFARIRRRRASGKTKLHCTFCGFGNHDTMHCAKL